ncbi:hypothetical protein TREES_T100014824 [Tupaia chinensis]|uniref:Uncharacterized protein n=1 Tax=Tupaia chinensis TaxID=246437 RepID=L9KUD4_TUPCH|nr:hypothetical protein TREES_T100014824 [Tupaia chinensis]
MMLSLTVLLDLGAATLVKLQIPVLTSSPPQPPPGLTEAADALLALSFHPPSCGSSSAVTTVFRLLISAKPAQYLPLRSLNDLASGSYSSPKRKLYSSLDSGNLCLQSICPDLLAILYSLSLNFPVLHLPLKPCSGGCQCHLMLVLGPPAPSHLHSFAAAALLMHCSGPPAHSCPCRSTL